MDLMNSPSVPRALTYKELVMAFKNKVSQTSEKADLHMLMLPLHAAGQFTWPPGLYTEIWGEFGVWKRGGGRKLTIVFCEAQGGCYTLCWHASITLACKMLILFLR